MAVDIVVKQGMTVPVFNQAVLDQYGNRMNLTGASVNFVMRALSASSPSTNAAATILNAVTGMVAYTFTEEDTATAGLFMGEFQVTFEDGSKYTWPNDGYLEISIEENLTAANGTELVTVADAKEVLNIPASDRTRDAKVLRWIRAIRPVIEQITGPIIPQVFEEWHDGGQVFVMVDRRPSVGYGTSPIFNVLACSEYNGSIEWPLSIIASPDEGQLYSCQPDVNLGRIVRRTAGGGVQAFPSMPQSVHVWYEAGQEQVPDNVYEAALDLLRINFQQTQNGRPRLGGSGLNPDDDIVRIPVGYAVPGRVREMLGVNERFPSLA